MEFIKMIKWFKIYHKKFLLILFLLLIFCWNVKAQDNRVFCSTTISSCQIATGVQWASGNQTWIFRPSSPEVSIYVFIHNNNPTNIHNSQVLTIWQTPSLTVNSLNSNSDLWTQDNVIQNSTQNASCNQVAANVTNVPGASGLGACYTTTLFASQVAIKITGAVSALGSPDTFDIFIIQKQGEPKSQANPISASGLVTIPTLQAYSESLSQGYYTSVSLTNPLINTVLLHINANNGTRSINLDRVILFSSVNTTININSTGTVGIGCVLTPNGSIPLKIANVSLNISTGVSNGQCGTNPVLLLSIIGAFPLLANTPITLDLRGFILKNNTTNGIEFLLPAGITGTINATLFWYEN